MPQWHWAKWSECVHCMLINHLGLPSHYLNHIWGVVVSWWSRTQLPTEAAQTLSRRDGAISLLVFQIGFQIKTRVQELGHGCIFLVQKAGALQITPSDSFTKRELIECARAVTEKVSVPSPTAGSGRWEECGDLLQRLRCHRLHQTRGLIAVINCHADPLDESTWDEVVCSERGHTSGGRLTVVFKVK